MKTNRPVGIIGYGAYVPRYRLSAEAISEVWREQQDKGALPVEEKSVPGPDEDTITMSIEASENAIQRAEVDRQRIQAVWVGSESHPYAVKPSGTIVAQALGITPNTLAGDFEFACKAGTETMQAAFGMTASGMVEYALAIAMDTAQGRPGDALEYTAAAGGAAYVIGSAENALAVLEGSYSHVTDTPDFFRRAYQKFPEHGNRFTGDPGYFSHIKSSVQTLLGELDFEPADFAAAVFHQPNIKFPQKVAADLGFTADQTRAGLLSPRIGNTYSGASPLGFTAALDRAKPGDKLLLASFGSGAGSDAFVFTITDKINQRQSLAPATEEYIKRRKQVPYSTYARWRKKIVKM